MGSKGKKGTKTRASEWSFCDKSGIGFHSSDSSALASLLDASNCPSSDEADFPHIHNSIFRSSLAVVATTTCGSFLSESQGFDALFLPAFVTHACDIGFGSLVTVAGGGGAGFHIVVRAFPHDDVEYSTKIVCRRGSWLARVYETDDGLLKVEKFQHCVGKVATLSVKTLPVVAQVTENLNFQREVKAFLNNKVLYEGLRIPYSYFGKSMTLVVTGKSDGTNAICQQMESIMLGGGPVTSTPRKERTISDYISTDLSTAIKFDDEEEDRHEGSDLKAGGLGAQEQLLCNSIGYMFSIDAKKSVNGILLYGPTGTGKTLLARSLRSKFKCFFKLVCGPELYSKFYGETEARLREIFSEAIRMSPSILVIDELDCLASKKEGEGGDHEKRIAATLQTCLDRIHFDEAKVAVIATTRRVESIAPSLRRPGRIDLEVEVGVPDVKGRLDILNIYFSSLKHVLSDPDIQLTAQETHGFVGADIGTLVSSAVLLAEKRHSLLSFEDICAARGLIKPSAMREVQVEVPTVRWSDIGGLDDLKLKLNQAVDWPIKHPELFRKMGIKPPRGVLMYGPPGCSKTMIAKALANESGLNFLSIKGPELFSKWVGESEKAVRDLFKRARTVAPCIVFFDEIDALGASRGGGGSRVGERVLAQLLTEMDGVESLVGVTVLAATNRPDMMDKALLRPGRLDRVIYVPLPDISTRRQILQIHSNNMPLDNVNLDELAKTLEGYSGAEIVAICNESALAALEEDSEAERVAPKHFDLALKIVKPRIQRDLIQIYHEFHEDLNKT